MPRPYPPEFRRRALDLVESGRTVRGVAASLGIAEAAGVRQRAVSDLERGINRTARKDTALLLVGALAWTIRHASCSSRRPVAADRLRRC
jgi:transposase-like protein